MNSPKNKDIFENLFVLEMANNHLGDLKRGRQLIRDHAQVVRQQGVKAAIKLQFRDVDSFIHADFKGNDSLRYIKKTEATKLTLDDLTELVNEINRQGCLAMATPFDEASVDLCVLLDLPIIKIASSDANDWPLIEKIASTRRPVIASTGGVSENDLDDMVTFFERRDIPLAINHCVSLYPSEDFELDLDQIDYLKKRYDSHVIGLSTHEYHDWQSSMLISYAKGARTWERHIDIDYAGVPVSPYCSLPNQCDIWFSAFHKAVEMCGGRGNSRRPISTRETEYLDALVRGIYARRDIEAGYVFSSQTFGEDFYLAIPLLKGQLSCREIMNGRVLTTAINAYQPLTIDHVDGPYSQYSTLRNKITNRGFDPHEAPTTTAKI